MLKTILKRAKTIPGIMIFFMVMCGIASAQTDGPSTKELSDSMNILWMLIAGFLVFFMQAGFALVETGFTRAKNVSHTMMMNMMVFCIGAIGYWLVGVAF
jgi:Amt family ammonium transporter